MADEGGRGPNVSRVDERVRHFGSSGLLTGGILAEADAIAINARRLDGVVVSDTAPEVVREHLEAICELHRHGAFEYRFFALAVTNAQLGLELALGHRFIEHYAGEVPMVNPESRQVELVSADSFEQIAERLRTKWRLDGEQRLGPSLGGLARWALATGAIRPWLDREWAAKGPHAVWAARSDPRGIRPPNLESLSAAEVDAWFEEHVRNEFEQRLLDNEVDLRNALAHRTSRFITTPVDSARAIAWYASLVNALWPPSDPGTKQGAAATISAALGGADDRERRPR